ncbi:MAG TPA: AI-2E family transporter [Candidatus Aquicultoraceae bacterium]|nr:AI-2E family transporter [Candidatus Aquicultoraceae bacterium]
MEPEKKSRVSPRDVWVVGLNVLALAAVLLALYLARQVLVLIVVAGFAAMAMNPAVLFLEGRRLGRRAAVAVVCLLALVLSVLVLVSFVPVLAEQGKNLASAAPDLVEMLRNNSVALWADREFGLIERSRAAVQEHMAAVAGSVVGIVTSVFRGIFGFATVVVLTVFMLLFGGELFDEAVALADPGRRDRIRAVTERIQRKVGGYVAGTLLVALIGGVATAVVLVILGVPYFLPLSLAMTLLGIVPYAGPAIGGVLVVSTTFAAAGRTAGVVMLIFFLAYQAAENNLLQPLVQRRTIRMNPLIILSVMLVGTSLAGVVGALLALPLAGAVQVVLREVLSGGDPS